MAVSISVLVSVQESVIQLFEENQEKAAEKDAMRAVPGLRTTPPFHINPPRYPTYVPVTDLIFSHYFLHLLSINTRSLNYAYFCIT